jgi:hypothetical protein
LLTTKLLNRALFGCCQFVRRNREAATLRLLGDQGPVD